MADSDDGFLWEAEGMAHRIALTEPFNDGVAVIWVESIRGGRASTGTLHPEERKSLARALDPESYAQKDELEASVKQLLYVLKDYNGAAFPGELTRQGKEVLINGFNALCLQGLEYMELKYGEEWRSRAFKEVPIEEQWDRISNSAAHNFMHALSEAVKKAEEATSGA